MLCFFNTTCRVSQDRLQPSSRLQILGFGPLRLLTTLTRNPVTNEAADRKMVRRSRRSAFYDMFSLKPGYQPLTRITETVSQNPVIFRSTLTPTCDPLTVAEQVLWAVLMCALRKYRHKKCGLPSGYLNPTPKLAPYALS